MKLFTCRCLFPFLFLASPLHAGDTLVQVSTIDALIKGIYDGGVSFGDLKKVGDFGIGTLDDLNGEMLALDGEFLQVTSDGKVHPIADNVETPFAAVTFFKEDKGFQMEPSKTVAELQAAVDAKAGSQNLFYAVKITGTFATMSLRSVPKQKQPYPPLPEVVKEQARFDLKEVKGTLVGFRCPPFVKGVNVPGYHFHFISEDKQTGGHVLECALTSGTASVDVLENLKLLLPGDKAFLDADFSTHDEKSVEAVEKLKK